MKSIKAMLFDGAKRRDVISRRRRARRRSHLLEALEQRQLLAVTPLTSLVGDEFQAPRNIGQVAAQQVLEQEPNNFRQEAQVLPLGTGSGQSDTIDVNGNLTRRNDQNRVIEDVDFYAVDLQAGDILDIASTGTVQSFDVLYPNQRLWFAAESNVLGGAPGVTDPLYPFNSPLQTLGNTVMAQVVPETGRYFIRVAPGDIQDGPYELGLRVYRPVLEQTPVGTRQTLFLDFDGATMQRSELDPTVSGVARLSPLASFLDDLGLQPEDEDLVINSVIDTVERQFAEVGILGSNDDFGDTGAAGSYGVRILNSRDHVDPWGEEHVSRIIIGGTMAQLGVPTLGLAATIDIGNFDTSETGVVLLDLLTGAGTPDDINTIPISGVGGSNKIDLVGEVIGTITSHEAAHFFGLNHTDNDNDVRAITDQGGNGVFDEAGVGPDGIYDGGLNDDEPMRFIDDDFAGATDPADFEGIYGTLRAAETLAYVLGSGRVGGTITGRVFVDANRNGQLNSGELGRDGVTVFADLDENGVRDSGEPVTTTAADGTYSLPAIAGDYPVRVQVPDGFASTTTEQRSVQITAGGSASGLNFGLSQVAFDATGFKWRDDNGNGIRDTGEPGIEGVYVYLDVDGDGRIDIGEPQTVTAADGSYTLDFPGPGTFTIREVEEPGFIQTFPGRDLDFAHTVTFDGTRLDDNYNFGNLPARDYGDAPASYDTGTAGPASHGLLDGIHLGANIDTELGPQPSENAEADDLNGRPQAGGGVVDDEDGVVLTEPLVPGRDDNVVRVTVENTTGAPALLQGWMDFDADGQFDADEQIITNASLATGTHDVEFSVPDDVELGEVVARFRYGYERNLGPTGAARAGEVEDYVFLVRGDAALAADDFYSVPRNSGPRRLEVLENDFQSELDPISIVRFDRNGDNGGTVQLASDGEALLYTPLNGFLGRDTFTYTVAPESDPNDQHTATVTVDVSFQAEQPIAVDDSFDISENDRNIALNVLANDIPGPGGALTVSQVQSSSGAIVARAGGGTAVRYTPPPGFVGTDQFTYTIQDATGATSTATATVHLLPGDRTDDLVEFVIETLGPNGQPIDVVRAGQEFDVRVSVRDLRDDVSPLTQGLGSAYLDLLYTEGLITPVANPSGNPFNFQIAFNPEFNGARTASAEIPGLIDEVGAFQSAGDQFGEELHLFTLRMLAETPGVAELVGDPADDPFSDVVLLEPADEELGLSDIRFGRKQITVVPGDGDFAAAVDDHIINPIDVNALAVELDVLANDNVGPTGLINLVPGGVTQPANGTVQVDTRGTSDPSDDVVLYTPDAGFEGTDQFEYRIDIPLEGRTDTATVTVQVGAGSAADDIVALDLEIFKDGTQTNQVQVGDEFQLRGFVQDLRPEAIPSELNDRRGVFAAFLDVIYDSGLVEPIADPNNDLGFEVTFVSPYNSGINSGDVLLPNTINELGAVQSDAPPNEENPGEPTGADRLPMFIVNLRAIAPGDATFVGDPADVSPFQDTLVFERSDGQGGRDLVVGIHEIRYSLANVEIRRAEGEFTNPDNALDVNADGMVSPIDALNVINDLNRGGIRSLDSAGEGESGSTTARRTYVDVNGDRKLTPADALLVINHLNRSSSRGSGEAEGEGALAPNLAGNTPSTDAAPEASTDAVFEDLSGRQLATDGFDDTATATASRTALPAPESDESDDRGEDADVLNLLASDVDAIWNG